MTSIPILLFQGLLASLCAVPASARSYGPATFTPPEPIREFRAAWVATVGNIDWPSRSDLSVAEQKSELLGILDRSMQLKLNAIVFQVRPACDALYASPIEPWSEYLTGRMGKAPQPFYDPLTFAIEEAHKRGLELHAWLNPYRARHENAKSPISANHISKTKPHLVRKYGNYLWLDPGEREVQDHALSVVMDLIQRYDVDGVHFDDYFYPYPERLSGGGERDFPDEASWEKFGAGGRLTRDDWRRENVNVFVRRVYESIKASKPWVKFGISPFGIWRPGYPQQIKGFDAYDKLYADARNWLARGWVDYFAPQLYWAIESREQSFPVLLAWWNAQNPKKRHIWPGMSTTRVREAWKAEEIINQIRLTSKQPVSAGHIHWNMKSLMRSAELGAALERGAYAEPALVPACKWLDSTSPPKPELHVVVAGKSSAKLTWEFAPPQKAWLWVLQYRRGETWSTRILPGQWRSHILDGEPPDALALSAVDRTSNVSSPATLVLKK